MTHEFKTADEILYHAIPERLESVHELHCHAKWSAGTVVDKLNGFYKLTLLLMCNLYTYTKYHVQCGARPIFPFPSLRTSKGPLFLLTSRLYGVGGGDSQW